MKMIRSIVMILLAGLLLGACQRAGGGNVQIGEQDAGKTVELRAGQKLVVVLEGNPTTGYTWETQPGLDESVLKPAGEPEFKPDSNAVGSGGKMTMTYEGLKPGEVTLTLLYHRPWEQNVDPLEVYEVTVKVVQ